MATCDFGTLSNIISAVATAATAIAAFSALEVWRKQRRSELAEEIIIHAHKLQGIITWVRCPAAFANEGKTRKPDQSENEEIKAEKDTYFVPLERLKNSNDEISKTYGLKLQASLYFPGIDVVLQELLGLILKIQSAASSLVRTTGSNYAMNFPEKHEENKNVIWEGGDENDVIKIQVNDIVKQIEQNLKRYI